MNRSLCPRRLLVWGVLYLLFYFSAAGWFWQDIVARKDKEARKLYEEEKIDEALSKWRDAQIESPEKKELHYNIGNALHKQKEYQDALGEYEKSTDAKNAELKAKTYYNIGNTHYRMGKLPEAIEDYGKCLEVTPDDEDAKYNIEFIKKKMEEQKKSDKEEKSDKEKSQEEKQQSQDSMEQESQGKEQETE
ncbi:MAG: tetratricopeptide repeat protein, partial [Candidatus Omnitrophica bacterium]|nr:tetratricopeptide repeat protein [Candidatus Omnitrophota bacterium]